MSRLAFLFDCDYRTRDLVLSWDDGLRAALSKIGEDWDVAAFAPGGQADFNLGNVRVHQRPKRADALLAAQDWLPDLALCWGSLDRPLHGRIREVAPKTAICFAGGPTQHPFLVNFDLIFAETSYHVENFQARGVNVRQAFGVNTDLFKPNPWQQPRFLAIQPASFAAYKRYGLFAKAFGKDGLAVGQVQLRSDGAVFEGEVCHEVCLRYGVAVIPRMVPYYMMPYMYGLAQTCVITTTTYGGGDRAVLEAMACGKPVIFCNDNAKLGKLVPLFHNPPSVEPDAVAIRQAAEETASTWDEDDAKFVRNWVLEGYSVEVYARQLREGLESLL